MTSKKLTWFLDFKAESYNLQPKHTKCILQSFSQSNFLNNSQGSKLPNNFFKKTQNLLNFGWTILAKKKKKVTDQVTDFLSLVTC